MCLMLILKPLNVSNTWKLDVLLCQKTTRITYGLLSLGGRLTRLKRIILLMDALGTNLTMPTFEEFCDHLTREKAKLFQLDSLLGSNTTTLVAQSSLVKKK